MKVKALIPFTVRNASNGDLTSVACGQIVEVTTEVGNSWITDGLAEAYTLVEPTGTKSITANANNIDVSAYAKADVNVPSVQPTGTLNITANGTYDVTNKASAIVNVSVGTFALAIEDFIFTWDRIDETYAFASGCTWADLIASSQNKVVSYNMETSEPNCWRFNNVDGDVYVGIGNEEEYLYERKALDYNGVVKVTDPLVADRVYQLEFGSQCLVAGTKIATEKSAKNVENIKVGDVVKSIDPETLEFTTATVNKVRNSYVPHDRMYSNVWYKYSFDDGSYFRITGQHRFFDVDTHKYEWAEDIKIGDRVYKIDGTMPKLVSVEKFEERVEYNTFWNLNYAPYFVDGFLSGNRLSPIPNIKP